MSGGGRGCAGIGAVRGQVSVYTVQRWMLLLHTCCHPRTLKTSPIKRDRLKPWHFLLLREDLLGKALQAEVIQVKWGEREEDLMWKLLITSGKCPNLFIQGFCQEVVHVKNYEGFLWHTNENENPGKHKIWCFPSSIKLKLSYWKFFWKCVMRNK